MKTLCLCVALFPAFLPTASAIDPISILLAVPEAGKVVGSYLGLVESNYSQVDRLIAADLKTGIALLKQSERSRDESDDLIREARLCFTRATEINSISEEKSRHRKAVALLGLWVCCKAQSDEENARHTLNTLARMPSTPSTGLIMLVAAKNTVLNPLIPRPVASHDDFRRASDNYDAMLKMKHAACRELGLPVFIIRGKKSYLTPNFNDAVHSKMPSDLDYKKLADGFFRDAYREKFTVTVSKVDGTLIIDP